MQTDWLWLLAGVLLGLCGGLGVAWFGLRPRWKRAAFDEIRESDEAWRTAEIMAERRKVADSGRKHPPRSDAGPPARVHRVKARPGRKRGA